MKWDCGLIRDLAPLVQDGACSEASRLAVEEHTRECESCRTLLERMGAPWAPPVEEPPLAQEGAAEERRKMRRSFGKLRRRWYRTLAMWVAAILLLGCAGTLTVGQVRGEGAAFTNLDEIWQAGRFLRYLQDGKFDKAVRMLSPELSARYWELQELLSCSDGAELEHYLQDYREVELDGEAWMLDSAGHQFLRGYWEQAGEGETDLEGEEFWPYLLANRETGLLVPEDVWERAAALLEPGVLDEGDPYVLVHTGWGDFYVNSGLREAVEREGTSAVVLYRNAALIPKRIYDAAKYAVLEEDAEWKLWLEETYGEVRDMTEEEFSAQMEDWLIRSLQAWQDEGYELSSYSFTEAYAVDGGWVIGMAINEKTPDDAWRYTLDLSFCDGRLDIRGWSFPAGSAWNGEQGLHAALNLYYSLLRAQWGE